MHNRPAIKATTGQVTTPPSCWRSVVESVVRANRQVIESAQALKNDQDAVQRDLESEPKRDDLDLWQKGTFDTATWLYHLVFGPGQPSTPFQAFVSDESPEMEGGIAFAQSPSRRASQTASPMTPEPGSYGTLERNQAT